MYAIKRFPFIFLLALLAVLSLPAAMQAEGPVILTDAKSEYPLGTHLQILEDKDKIWTIEEVSTSGISQLFAPSQDEVPSFGFTDSAYWVRFQVLNQAGEMIPWLLLVDSNLFFVDVYVPADNVQGYDVTQTGMARPYDARAIDHLRFLPGSVTVLKS